MNDGRIIHPKLGTITGHQLDSSIPSRQIIVYRWDINHLI
jgi:hypothetical protein